MGGFRNIQIARMREERAFVEMQFEIARKKRRIARIGFIALFDEKVLLVYYGKIGKHPKRFYPCGVQGFVFFPAYRKDFGQVHPKRKRYIGIFTDDTVVFHCQQRKLTLQRRGFKNTSHN